ncbi:alpha/beta fold hydrolase [Litoribacter populi]|uniref:alpha/beta fold hydrolase n=1 Tax=Litoribacter populi TaxID=2598460 RepID=UPI001180F5E6|nr:alpha/beta hydrolase [Litoribacter populi]
MKTVQLSNHSLGYIEKGEGDPIILVHGSLSDYRSWSNQFEAFSKDYHTISYSRRYHYPNTPPTDSTTDYAVPLHARDLIDFIENLKLGPVNLVGSSYGAFVGFYAAIQRPELFKTLVMGEPPVPFADNHIIVNFTVQTFPYEKNSTFNIGHHCGIIYLERDDTDVSLGCTFHPECSCTKSWARKI